MKLKYGVKIASSQDLLYKSGSGRSPLKPAISHPQNGFPERDTFNPAIILDFKASYSESSSPTQNKVLFGE